MTRSPQGVPKRRSQVRAENCASSRIFVVTRVADALCGVWFEFYFVCVPWTCGHAMC